MAQSLVAQCLAAPCLAVQLGPDSVRPALQGYGKPKETKQRHVVQPFVTQYLSQSELPNECLCSTFPLLLRKIKLLTTGDEIVLSMNRHSTFFLAKPEKFEFLGFLST